jgi:hypothetical protein
MEQFRTNTNPTDLEILGFTVVVISSVGGGRPKARLADLEIRHLVPTVGRESNAG